MAIKYKIPYVFYRLLCILIIIILKHKRLFHFCKFQQTLFFIFLTDTVLFPEVLLVHFLIVFNQKVRRIGRKNEKQIKTQL